MTEPPGPQTEVPLPPGWRVGEMVVERDLDGVVGVDVASFTNPWTRQTFEWEARNSDVAHVFVLRSDEDLVVGYCSVWLIFNELHINNLAILPDWRRRQLGAALLSAVLAEGVRRGATRATLEVRASNDAARALYQRFHFREVGVRRAYYTNPVEDALILWREGLA